MNTNEKRESDEEAYDREYSELRRISNKKREEILANPPPQEPGVLDGPLNYEICKINRWFGEEVRKLKQKYNI